MEDIGNQLLLLGRAGIAALLGALIGLERELQGRPAGLRTHLLVAAASALFIPLGMGLVDSFSDQEGHSLVQTDPIRVIEATITGISFIGAGTIIFRERDERIEGITTAASILFTAAIGTAVGLEHYVVAVGGALAVVCVLYGVGRLENALARRGILPQEAAPADASDDSNSNPNSTQLKEKSA